LTMPARRRAARSPPGASSLCILTLGACPVARGVLPSKRYAKLAPGASSLWQSPASDRSGNFEVSTQNVLIGGPHRCGNSGNSPQEWPAQTRECRRRTLGTCAGLEELQITDPSAQFRKGAHFVGGNMHLRPFAQLQGGASGLPRKRSSRWTGEKFCPLAGEVRERNGLQPSRSRCMLPAIGTAKRRSRITFWVIGSERGFRGHAAKGWESQPKKLTSILR
jgi:hypothetical protein